jgi:predicted MFS family arabinose efflux permease
MVSLAEEKSQSREPGQTFQRWQVLSAGIAALVLTIGIARFAYTPLLPIMHVEAGLSAVAGGWLAAANYAGYLTGALIAVRTKALARKFLMYRGALALGLIGTAGMALTQDAWVWAGLRFIAGLGATGGMLLGSGLILNWLIREGRRPELGLHFAGLGLGITVSGLMVAPLAGLLAWDEFWLAFGALALVLLVPAWGWMPAPAPVDAPKTFVAPPPPAPGWMVLMVLAYFCAGVGYVVSATFTVAIVEAVPVFAGLGSWVWCLVGLSAVPGGYLIDRLAARFGQIRALVIAYVGQIISFLLPVAIGGAVANVASAALYGVTFVGIVGLTMTIVGRQFPDNPAKAMARMTLSYGLAQMTAPAVAGYMARATGGYLGALVMAAVAMAIGIGLLLLAARVTRRAGGRPA